MPVAARVFTPARPARRSALRMRWLDLLFLHWPVPAAALRPFIPDRLEIDTADGTAWVGLVPFTMTGVRHTCGLPLPTLTGFCECNVRTYVVADGEPGVWFMSLDAASRLAVLGARWWWNLNYVHARIASERSGDTIDYTVTRTGRSDVSMRCAWRAGAARSPSAPGELAHFLTERYAMYAADPRGRVRRGRIWHEPWTLREATLLTLEDGLVAANDIAVDPDFAPIAYHADRLDVEAWPLSYL